MDPNETLRRLRRAMIQLSGSLDAYDQDELIQNQRGTVDSIYVSGVEAVDTFQALDNWLASGGFQPNWDRAKTGGGS